MSVKVPPVSMPIRKEAVPLILAQLPLRLRSNASTANGADCLTM
jgi:hypothetical protein